MKKTRRIVQKKLEVEQDLDASFQAKKSLIDQSMDVSYFGESWLESILEPPLQRKTRPQSKCQIDYGKLTTRDSFMNYRASLKISSRERVDIKSIVFPLGCEEYEKSRALSARNTLKVSKEIQKMISLVSLKNSERSSICQEREREPSRYMRSEPKKPAQQVRNPMGSKKIAALRELLINRRRY